MNYKVGDIVRVLPLIYDQTGRSHYVTKAMAAHSNKMGQVVVAERHYGDKLKYKLSIDGLVLGWYEHKWLAAKSLDNREVT